MALVRSTVAKLSPAISLNVALSDFESILTDEQKLRFAATLAPDPNAAIKLAFEIDHDSASRRGRCLGVRILKFLESVQQFSGVVGTFVSSNPQIAALIWGGVKMSLLVVNNFASYFDKLSTVLMQVGRTCPRLAEFGSLYITSPRLQTVLCEYYAMVVKLCKSAIEFSRKSVVSQVASALLRPFDVEFGPFQRQLLELSDTIREEISLASNKAQVHEATLQTRERKLAKEYRISATEFQNKMIQEQREARLRVARLRVLDKMTIYDYEKSWKYVRRQCLQGTCEWVLERPEWKDWIQESQPASLWCTGSLGSGKTVIAAFVVSHLLFKSAGADRASYFFCRYDDSESTIARTIVRSIARQLLYDLPHETFAKLDSELQASTLDVREVYDVLETTLLLDRQYFIVIDGLNECDDTEVQQVIEILDDLQKLSNLKIKVYHSYRTNSVSWPMPTLWPLYKIAIGHLEMKIDIEHYIQVMLERNLKDDILQVGNPHIILAIEEALIKGAQGMFLWVVFQMHHICAQRSDHDILEAIRGLPRDLPRTFNHILRKLSQTKDIKLASQIFDWLAVVKRPLTLKELREDIAIDPSKAELAVTRLVNDMTQALSCCGCFVVIDEEQETVHFPHHSIQQFLLSDAGDLSLAEYHVDLPAAERQAGEACVAYLNFGVFDRRVAKAPVPGTKIADIPTAITHHMMPRSRLATKLIALNLLTDGKKDKMRLNKTIQKQLESVAGQIPQQTLFLAYASKWWIWHLWQDLLRDDTGKAEKPWVAQEWSGYDLNNRMLHWATENNHVALIYYMIISKKLFDPRNVSLISEVLKAQVKNNAWDLIYYILGNMSTYHAYDILRTLLLVSAAGSGKLRIIQICVRDGADPHNIQHCSVLSEFGLTVEAPLFSTKPLNDLKLERGQYMLDWWSPVGIAAAAGHSRIIDYITSLSSNPQIFTSPFSLPQALLVSAAFDHGDIFHDLLNLACDQHIFFAGNDVGYHKSAERLLDVNQRDENGWSTLMYAVAFLDLDLIVQLIDLDLKQTLDLRGTPDHSKRSRDMGALTPLAIATMAGREDVRQFLFNSSGYKTLYLTPELIIEESPFSLKGSYPSWDVKIAPEKKP